jgi:uncharacterized protein (DUF1501 family)
LRRIHEAEDTGMSSRRSFIKGCAAGALTLGAGNAIGWFDPLHAQSGVQREVLVHLFLRGGIDGLHLLVPHNGPDRTSYEARRGTLAIPAARLRPIAGTPWGWHPRAGGGTGDMVGTPAKWLQSLYQQNALALVHATGMSTVVNRSHFDTQSFIELGTPGAKGTADGWIARLLAADNPDAALLAPALGFSNNQQTSLIGADAITLANAQEFRVDGFHWSWNDSNGAIAGHLGAHTRLLPLWSGDSSLERAGRAAAEALAALRSVDFRLQSPSVPDGYAPSGGAEYPTSGNGSTLGTQFRHLAHLIKLDAGLRVVAMDYGFWDTHENQGMPNPGVADHWDPFGNLLEGLGRALQAFHTDMSASGYMDRITVVIQSEFGRRFRPNDSAGTDHGYGNLMLALGGGVVGGQMHGTFPGLDDASLFEGQDVAVTTDYRQVLAEALVKRLGLPTSALASVFPGFGALGAYAPRGVFSA